jgi:hypothetical protein
MISYPFKVDSEEVLEAAMEEDVMAAGVLGECMMC